MAFLDENGLAHLWQGLKGKFLALTGGTVNGNLHATGNVSAAGRITCSAGDIGIGIGTGVLLLQEGGIRAQGSGAHISTDGSVNAGTNVTAGGNISATGSLSTYGYTVPRIQHGNLYVDVAADSAADFQITFPKAFPGAPNVVVTPRHSADSFGYDLRVKLKTVTATGATGMIYYGNGGTWIIHWVAVYG